MTDQPPRTNAQGEQTESKVASQEAEAGTAAEEAEVISDYIRHTDSGSGRSQETPWSPTVGRPS